MAAPLFGHPELYKLEKGRLKLPTRFMPILGEDGIVYLEYIGNRIARCVPREIYEGRLEEMLKRPIEDQERQLFFLAEKVEADKQHRLRLKGVLASLDYVVVAPNGDVLDIYDPSEFPHRELLSA